jgi:hypothetical protein
VYSQELEKEKEKTQHGEGDTTELWKLMKAMNDEEYSGQKITLKDDNKTLTVRTEANTLAKA